VRQGWNPNGEARWQGGPDRIVATGNHHTEQSIRDVWTDGDWGAENPTCKALNAAIAAFDEVRPGDLGYGAESSTIKNTATLPEWARNAVFYQIFPLGYFGAPTVNDQKSKVAPRLKQIREHYKHLEELGVDAVYFSPLFESGTHGYDTFDYFEIDRRLGDVKLFKQIVKELHEHGIKVVLDGVFNHTGTGHFAFKDLTINGPNSQYAGWYHLGARKADFEGYCVVDDMSDSGFSYDCWEGHPVLPRLNLENHDVKQHIFDVARFWVDEVGIDGWRLDVAHEIEPDFWREFRAVCDNTKLGKDCLLVGEMIHGNYNYWVGDDRLHSGTNYQMSHATWFSLNDRNYEYFYNALLRENCLFSGLTLVNFLGNHDVPRVASNITNPKHYLHAMVVLLLMKGIPCLYYGDEFGMEGTPADGTDEHSGGDDAMRRPMLDCAKPATWPAVGVSRVALNKKLIKIRREHPVFGIDGTQDIEDIQLLSNDQIIVTRYVKETDPKTKKEEVTAVGCLVFNCGDYSVDPWPEITLPHGIAAARKGEKFTDLLVESPPGTVPAPGAGQFLVNDGGKIYAGPLGPDSVKVLLWEKPKPIVVPKTKATPLAAKGSTMNVAAELTAQLDAIGKTTTTTPTPTPAAAATPTAAAAPAAATTTSTTSTTAAVGDASQYDPEAYAEYERKLAEYEKQMEEYNAALAAANLTKENEAAAAAAVDAATAADAEYGAPPPASPPVDGTVDPYANPPGA